MRKLELEALRKSGRKINEGELENIKSKLKESPIAPLMKAGLFDVINEDLNLDELKFDKADEYYEKGRAKLPGFIQTGLDIVLVSERTRLNKLLFKATQYGDFIARYAMYVHNRDNLKLSEEENLNRIRDQFIDYNLPTSAGIKMLNDYGLAMFTKYYTRLQRPLAQLVKQSPTRAALGLMSMFMLPGFNISDPFEGSIFTKDLAMVASVPLVTPAEYFASHVPLATATGL
ncbi:hypothetical protein [Campylobacter sp. 7477a]|uniref:hypothetical protein n=1 Tax=Campylobacter sp. 7477a TaxID=2735741 RepID=UPI003014666A|nr:hypothetical protein [Campylobacter sp. 7477a]